MSRTELTSEQVHIAATYVVPAASPAPRHKVYNVVTLVGPSKGAGTPRIVWSTTKHNPVPFVESYANLIRSDASLGSSPDRLPLARIELPHRPHTPSPSLTPLQSIDVSGVICLDIAFPSLVNSYTVPFFSEAQPLSPALIFNPSATPSTLARVQFEQMRARAIEQRTFVLRCDSDTGISGLVAPDGTVRVIRYADEGWNSWETDIDAERGKGRTFFAMLKSEWSVWAMMVGLTLFAALGDYGGGAVARRTMEVARRTLSKFSKLGGSRDERLVDV
jgi:apolipoprotein N-acyltransferase